MGILHLIFLNLSIFLKISVNSLTSFFTSYNPAISSNDVFLAFVILKFNQSTNYIVTLLLPIALAIAVACKECILAINFLIEKGLFNALLLIEKFYLLKGTQPAPDWYFLEAGNMAGNYSEEYLIYINRNGLKKIRKW